MNRTILTIVVVILLIVGGALALSHKSDNNTGNNPATYGSNNQPSGSGSSQAEVAPGTVDIKNMMFTPSQITIKEGDTVTWTNNDNIAHTVTDDLSNVGGPASGNIPPGGSYSFTFKDKGSYQYHCNIHPSMRGTIVVQS